MPVTSASREGRLAGLFRRTGTGIAAYNWTTDSTLKNDASPGKFTEAKFGTVKVHARLLSAAAETKTYVITTRTTARDLVGMVITSYRTICEDNTLFNLVLESGNSLRAGVECAQRIMILSDDAKVLDEQSKYPRGNTRLTLQMKPGVGVVTVHDGAVQSQNGTIGGPRSVFITEKTSCKELIELVLRAHKVEETSQYALFEVDSDSKDVTEIGLDERPLGLLQQRLDPYQYYFEVRKLDAMDTNDSMRRTHSLNSLEEIGGKPKRILNIREVRKSMTQKKRSSKYNCLDTNSNETKQIDENKETTMAKLRDSLTKLREHLDNLQKKKGFSYDSDNENDMIRSNGNDNQLDAAADEADKAVLNNAPHHTTSAASHYHRHPVHINQMDRSKPAEDDNNNDEGNRSNGDGDDDTGGDTSMNESDAASTGTSQRGTNDSAYASDRVSYSSAQRQQQRRNSYTSSDNSTGSPEIRSGPSMKKAYSLMELPGEEAYRPSRVKSASYAQGKNRAKRRVNDHMYNNNHYMDIEYQGSPTYGSWSRRKEYEAQRNARAAEVIRRTQSLQIRYLADHETDRPQSAEYSTRSRPVSATSSRGKVRRALPKVPGTIDDLEDRKKRMSMEALDKIRRNSLSYHSTVTDSVSESPASSIHAYSQNVTSPETPKSPMYNHEPSEPRQFETNCYQEQPVHTNLSQSNKDKYRLPPNNVCSYEKAQESHQIFKPQVLNKQHSTSQEALQRIINDLKDAAVTKPNEGNSRRGSYSSDGSVARECDYTDAPPLEDQHQQQQGYDFAQLAQWGVIQPTQEELMSYKTQYGDPNNHPEYDDEDSAEIKVTHPSLHRIVRSCDLVHVTLHLPENHYNNNNIQEYGLQVFESTFSDLGSDDKERRPIFRSPSGRRPVIGRKKGAFMPVTPVKSRREGPILSLTAVDEIKEGSVAANNGQIQEGDYILEVNGLYVGDANTDRVKSELATSGNVLHLVLARYKPTKSKGETKASDMSEKEVEKLKLKYAAMKQDSEKNMDQIAELKLELKDKEEYSGKLEIIVRTSDEKLRSFELNVRKKDEEIGDWKYEANHRNIELARLKFENKQKEDRIVQLRRLLIQQTEVMQLQQGASMNGNVSDLDDFEEHVSAV